MSVFMMVRPWKIYENYIKLNIYLVCAQSCLTVCDPVDYNPPGSSLSMWFSRQEYWIGCHFLLQTEVLNLCPPVSCLDMQTLYHWATWPCCKMMLSFTYWVGIRWLAYILTVSLTYREEKMYFKTKIIDFDM